MPHFLSVASASPGRILDAGVGTGRNFSFYPRAAKVVGVEGEDDGLVLGEELIEIDVAQPIRMFGVRLQLHEIDDVDYPCLMMAPAYEASSRELEPQVWLIKLNSDAERAVASRLGIRGIPTMILFLEGREVARTSGAMSATQIVRWVRTARPLSLSEPADGPAISAAGTGLGGWPQATIRGYL